MYGKFKEYLTTQLETLKSEGLYKNERVITSPRTPGSASPADAAS